MTDRTVVHTTAAPAAIGPYSQAIVAAGLVHCSGQVALDPEAGELVGSTAAEQTVQVFKNLAAVLAEAGSGLEHVLKCNVYLADMNDFANVNAVYAEHFAGDTPPARATVQVSRLPKDALVEIDCVALVG
jgi:2-iminobutanoate/2-iminopropanoate deaminase